MAKEPSSEVALRLGSWVQAERDRQVPHRHPSDAQFYPEGIKGWMVQLNADPKGGITPDPDFFLEFEGERPHQVRLQGGDASSDSVCYP